MDFLMVFLDWLGILDREPAFCTNGDGEFVGNGSVHWRLRSVTAGHRRHS
jgi:hypothetical protein